MWSSLPPAAVLLLGALAVPFLPRKLRVVWICLLPLASFWHLLRLEDAFVRDGPAFPLEVFGYELQLGRLDGLATAFALAFHVAGFLAILFSLHVKDWVQPFCALLYMGSAIGGVCAGDLLSFFCYWEITAIASVFLVWASKTERAYRAGMRYLLFQVGSGVLLLAGVLLHHRDTGTLGFGYLGAGGLGRDLILIAFGVKACFPLLHTWLTDAYPEATPSGSVFLSIFTTKMAVYALARGFPGFEGLLWVGGAMALFPILFALVENDLRRVLAYGLVSQLGFKVAAVGMGTAIAINGAVAHSFAGILYTALLFMAIGAVLHRTGSARATDLGGLWTSMRGTAVFCLVGAASISALPGTGGFTSKSLILTAAAEEHHTALWFVLLLASAGTILHTGLRLPYLAFFGKSRGIDARPAPLHMLVAMGLTAALCVGLGVGWSAFYETVLPYEYAKSPYDATHVVTQLQLVLFAALAFALLRRRLAPRPAILLDSDWTFRRALPSVGGALFRAAVRAKDAAKRAGLAALRAGGDRVYRHLGPEGFFARTWSTSGTVLWVAVILTLFLLLYYA